MGYFFAILGSAAAFFGAFAITAAFSPPVSDTPLIVGCICGVMAAVFWVGAGIIFRMDEQHSKKDVPK